MTRISDQAKAVAYPRLTAGQIDALIGALIETGDTSAGDDVFGYLVSFYTRRWGLPPALRASVTPSPES